MVQFVVCACVLRITSEWLSQGDLRDACLRENLGELQTVGLDVLEERLEVLHLSHPADGGEEREDAVVDHVGHHLRNVGSRACHVRRRWELLLDLCLPLLEELVLHQLRPASADAPGLAGVREISSMKKDADKELSVFW